MTEKPIEQALRAFRALGDENRLRLIVLLREGEQCVCDLSGAIGVSQPLLSFHLKTLKDAGLMMDRREGRWVYYALNGDGMAELQRLLRQMTPLSTPSPKPSRRCG